MSTLNTPTALAVGSLFALTLAMVLLFFIPVPDKNAQIVGAVIGYVAAMAQVAASYYFGSSTSSKTKDETISVLSDKMTGTGDGTAKPKPEETKP